MTLPRDVTISADDMEFVYQAVLQYGRDLLRYSSWLKSKEGKPLPGMDAAVVEVDKEVELYRALAINLYRECYTPKPTDGVMAVDPAQVPQRELDALLDHIYEHGTTAEGIRPLALKLCQAYADGVNACQNDQGEKS
jgi:hypothetical protein